MAKTHKVTIRIEEDMRKKAHEATEEMGLSLSEYIYKQLTLLVKRKELNDQLLSTERQMAETLPKKPVGVTSLVGPNGVLKKRN
ncbi:type II toxin-antitoxin system RelB/DinJ family antitoxin [Photobacterium carnosum]|uniref:type II toxin-antitoxin system RelB/DinJ family antitoxin n=1 Tax=Photobacterium carnosum TaxID=2023717 RepID=UPI001E5534D0|nr:hypothetical protein [Photobacterium carnosum]MCD9517136.1 hypothetical protein [Photobacterium carnosum]